MRRPLQPAIAGLVCTLLLVTSARAGLVSPGETVGVNSSDFALPGGTLLAEKTSPFAISYGGTDALKGTLYSAVYDIDGALAFLYDVDFDQANPIDGATERSELRVAAFAGLTTHVSGMLDHEEVIQASRSADGNDITLFSDTPGLGGAPALVVRTNATSYDDLGSAVFIAGDEMLTMNVSARSTGSASIEGAFQPTLDGGNGQVPPSAIPLPPAAYSGLGVLLAMGIIIGVKRLQAGRTATA